jgi:hypothetical protein
MERVMTYRDRLAAFTKSSRHRRMRLLVMVFATLHIAGNVFVIMRGRAQGMYAGESMLQTTIVYWIAVTLVFWAIVYVVCRFTMPLFEKRR